MYWLLGSLKKWEFEFNIICAPGTDDRWGCWLVLVYNKTVDEHPVIWFRGLPRKSHYFNSSHNMWNYITKFFGIKFLTKILVQGDASKMDHLTQDDCNFPDLWNCFMIAHKFIASFYKNLSSKCLKKKFLYSSKKAGTIKAENYRLKKTRKKYWQALSKNKPASGFRESPVGRAGTRDVQRMGSTKGSIVL